MIKLLLLLFLTSFIFAKDVIVYVNSHLDKKAAIERWQPTIDLLNKKIPTHKFKLLPIPPTEVDLIKELVDQKQIDLLITQPAITNILIHSNSISPILTMVNKYKMSKFGSVFITQHDNDEINALKDIKGKSIAAVAPMGFGGWLIGYNELFDQGIDPEKDGLVTFTGSQNGVISLVNEGTFDVGVIKTGMIEKLAQKGRIDPTTLKVINHKIVCSDKYNIFCSTKLYPEWSLSKTDHMDIDLVNQIFKVFVDIKPTDLEAIKGQYYDWHLPESFKEVDDLFKKFYLGHYSDMQDSINNKFYKIFFIGFSIIIVLAVIVVLIIRYRLLKSNEKRIRKTLDKAEEVAQLGHWELDFNTNEAKWSNQIFNIFGMKNKPTKVGPDLLKKFTYVEDFMLFTESINRVREDHSKEHNVIYRIVKNDTKETRWMSCIGKYNEKTQKLEGTLQDITDFKNTKDELKKQKELLLSQSKASMMGEMFSLLMHQFKQPLSVLSISTNNQVATIELEGKLTKEEVIENAKNVNIQVKYLSDTMDTFRDFLKPDNKKVSINIEDTIEKSLTIVGQSLKNNNVELEKEFNSKSKVNIIDSEMIQVFINLINNSKDAFKINKIDNRKIWIRTFDKDSNVVVEIEDNAGGIPDDKIESIFENYFTLKKKYGGTGLGLYIVKIILEEHFNATIEVVNTNDGVIFTISMPV